MSEEDSKESLSPLLPLRSSFVAGSLFFNRRIELPEGLQDDELEGAVTLELENLSPFPLEHLQYGYCLASDKRHAYAFAAYKRRFERQEVEGWSKLDALIPDFSFALLSELPGSEAYILVAGDSVTFVKRDSASKLPASLRSALKSELIEAEEAQDASDGDYARAMMEHCGIKRIRCLSVDATLLIAKETVVMNAKDIDSGEVFAAATDRRQLWELDIRDPDWVAAARMEHRRNAILWKVVLGSAAAIALFMLGELIFGASYGYLASLRSWNEKQTPIVTEIQSKDNSVNELMQFEESDLVPFDMLLAIEPYRSPEVVFSKVETDGPNRLLIDAKANSVNARNAFKSRLEGFAMIDSVEMLKERNESRGTTFQAALSFVPGSFPAAGNEVDNG